LEACFNFRDLGGYDTASGGRVRWGTVFRSGSLHRLTIADRERIMGLGVRTIIDLRSSTELARDGNFDASGEIGFHHVPVEDASVDEPQDDWSSQLSNVYYAIATANHSAIATAFGVVAEDEHPVVIHCFAGKDRTGIIAALILSSLGVPDTTIASDYQLSGDYVAPAVAWATENDPEWAAHIAALPPHVLRAPPSTMPMFLDLLRDQYGSIDNYLIEAGADRTVLDVLRTRLLEP
jgi:protein-tyrosine phosphatase